MFRLTAHWIRRLCTLAVCGTVLCSAAHTAHAAPPLTRTPTAHPAARFDSGARLDSVAKLDLRLPAQPDLDAARPLDRFGRTDPEMQSQSLHLSDDRDRVVGRVQAMAERFRHEGLPVARLWENHSALVSLGLNSRGKPGIWLVQKIH
jgi:hypothetical protein